MLLLSQCHYTLKSISAMEAIAVSVMAGNSDVSEIWEQWQPVVEILQGCNGWPMVTHDGHVAEGWQTYHP